MAITSNDDADDSTIKPQPDDNDTPFSPPDTPPNDPTDQTVQRKVQGSSLDDTHQVTDSDEDLDPHEHYDEGLSGVAEAGEPNAGDAVVGYDPDKDQRRKDDKDDQEQGG